MRTIILTIFAVCLVMPSWSQTAKEEIKKNACLSASNFLAYPGPQKALTPAPKGLKPFYISHYGRHGSRYMTSRRDYDYAYFALQRADSLGKLTELGKDVLHRLALIRDETEGRFGELTPLGARQHKEIARRMFERFPEVFADGATVDARSTVVIRCILSMSNALHQLLALNPKLKVSQDASVSDMYYMNQEDKELWAGKTVPAAAYPYDDFCRRHDRSAGLMARLFNDTAYVNHRVNATRLNSCLFTVASNVQNTELRKRLTFYDIYTDEELYHNWLIDNARSYIGYGGSKLTQSLQPFSQRNLLRRIIEEADSCIKLGQPCASLRFGHETIVMPLVCLLGLNNFDLQMDDLEQLDRKGWRNYRIFPMAANLQFVFYRKDTQDTDVMVKVLLNEDEAKLPIKSNMEPYYRWRDLRDYYLKKLAEYQD